MSHHSLLFGTVLLFLLLGTLCGSSTPTPNPKLQAIADEIPKEPKYLTDLAALHEALLKSREMPLEYLSDPDLGLKTPDLIKARGFPCETHQLITSDGYILTLHRIPQENATRRGTVLLQHGLIDSSSTWANNFADQSMAFRLHKHLGLDVWLSNIRGNYYSNSSTKYKPTEDAFWDFSWDEHALIDIPEIVQYVAKVLASEGIDATKDKIHYVGHSQGTTMAFAALSHPKTKPFMDAHIASFTALAPVVFPAHVGGLIRALAIIHFDKFVNLFGHGEFLLSTHVLEWLLPHLCESLPMSLCRTIVCSITGCNMPSVNETRIPVYVSHTPAGSSVKNMAHWSRMVLTNRFEMFDYGSAKANIEHYGTPEPPRYDISKVSVPMSIYYGGQDTLGVPPDVEALVKALNQEYVKVVKFFESWGHLDFTWGITHEVTDEVISFLRAQMV